jgi:hypothetical protein
LVNAYAMCTLATASGPSCTTSLGTGVLGAAFSPDGSRAAFVGADAKSVIVVSTAGDKATYDFSSLGYSLGGTVLWAPDGARIFLTGWNSSTTALVGVRVDGGPTTPFTVTPRGGSFNPNYVTLSSDGSAIALIDTTSTGSKGGFVVDLGGELHTPTSLPPAAGYTTQWIPGGHDLAYSSSSTTLTALTNVLTAPTVAWNADLSPYMNTFWYGVWSADGATAILEGNSGWALGRATESALAVSAFMAPTPTSGAQTIAIDGVTPGFLYEGGSGLYAVATAPGATPFRIDTDLAPCAPLAPTAPGIVACTDGYQSVSVAKITASGTVVRSPIFTYGPSSPTGVIVRIAESP